MQDKPNIAYIYTSRECTYGKSVPAAITNCGGVPVVLDYLEGSIDLEAIDKQVLQEFLDNNDKGRATDRIYDTIHNTSARQEFIKEIRAQSNVILENKIRTWLKENNISGIMIPGDKYNYDCEPYHAEPKIRPRFSAALLNIAKEQGMPLVGVCGGLQAVAAAEGITLNRVAKILGKSGHNAAEATFHVLSDNNSDIDPYFLSRNARRQTLMPGTNLQKIVGNGSVLLPEAHGGAIDHTDSEGLIQLHQLGYKIAARSPDGIIQAVENISPKNHITLFQGHPEALACIGIDSAIKILQGVLIEPAKKYLRQQNHNASGDVSKTPATSFVLQLVSDRSDNKAHAHI